MKVIQQSNILIDGENNAYLNDFGSSRALKNTAVSDDQILRACTLRYAAPELVSQTTQPNRASDMYSFGCIIFEVTH